MENEELSPVGESRRDVLKKIGLALAASSLAALPQKDAEAQTELRQGVKLQGRGLVLENIKPLVAGHEGKEFSAFFAKSRGGLGSVVVIPGDDKGSTEQATKTLGVKPARGKIVGGIIQVDLGVAAEGRCSGNGKAGAASFDPIGPGGDPFKGLSERLVSAPISRIR